MPIGTDLLPGVPLYTFNYIWDDPQTRHIGPLAQGLQRVMPSAVYENEDGYLLLNWDKYEQLVSMARLDVSKLAAN